MASLFTKIINGELPGRFVWRDPEVVAFLTIAPLVPGHTLVVPVAEVDQWLDLDPAIAARCFEVAGHIGRAQRTAFGAPRAGLMIAGFEVPHVHLHVWPSSSLTEYDVAKANPNEPAEALDAAAATLRQALVDAGHPEAAPATED